MPDYGHDLLFGVFITPVNAPPERPVELALLAEQAGLDLATFQDHPYQAAFHDTWTLLSWVAAATSRIHVSGNVLNAQLRQPAVLARAAASLDLLSGGRLELGLGAGGFADPIAAMGQPKLTPGEAVTALGETIDILRGIWDVTDRSALRVAGKHHSVDGAKRGPAPAHDIPIWLGARMPRMLRLAGARADGWLPSLPWLQPGDLARGNAIIDRAATEAGRDPREVRRLLNLGGAFLPEHVDRLQGPPAAWVDDLLPLALEDGVSAFILATDDPATIRTFAQEVAPALRDAVARAREEAGTATARVRTASALARRREGIDYDAVPGSLAEAAIEPGDARYPQVRNTYMRGGSPGLVLPVGDASQVADALAFARKQDVPLGIRSGGHGISGLSTNDGGIVISLRGLDSIEILDEERRLVRVGAGARWVDVAEALASHGWAITSGDYGGVGVGGLATAGGIGWFAREQGLTIDHVRRVELVTVDGRQVTASADEHPELFWGMRGAGANFGVATSFDLQAHEGGTVGFAQLAFDATAAEGGVSGFLEGYGRLMEAAPRDTTIELIAGGGRPGQPTVVQLMGVVHAGDPDVVVERLQPFADLAPLLQQSAQLVPYVAVMSNVQPGPHDGRGDPLARSGLVDHLDPEWSAATAEMLERGITHFLSLRPVGGAVADIAQGSTAYSNRAANFSVAALGSPRSGLDQYWEERMAPLHDGLYISFESPLRPESIERAWSPDTLQRLRALKREWDPDGVLRDNFFLG
jgi:FAD/FMN-containing dehydrogenase